METKTQEQVQQEVLELCQATVHPSVEAETNMLTEGLLDSFHALKVVTQLEERFSLEIELSALSEEQVKSPSAIARFVFELMKVGE